MTTGNQSIQGEKTFFSQFLLRVGNTGNISHFGHGYNKDIYIRSGSGLSGAGKVILQDSGGNVGIGTSSPGKKLHVVGEIAASNNITSYYSDERLKQKLGTIKNPIEKIKTIETFYYTENYLAKNFGFNNNKKQFGVSAQNVEKVLPECVSLAPFDFDTKEDGTLTSKSGENYKTVDYSRLVPLLIEAIKEQQTQIDELKKEIVQIKNNKM